MSDGTVPVMAARRDPLGEIERRLKVSAELRQTAAAAVSSSFGSARAMVRAASAGSIPPSLLAVRAARGTERS